MSRVPAVFRNALTDTLSKAQFERAQESLRTDLLEAQAEAREAGLALVLLLMGDDRVGIHEALDALLEWLDPRHVDALPNLPASDEERGRPLAWRFWRNLPARGRTGVFLGGWTGELARAFLLDERPRAQLPHALEQIQSFERSLVDDGVLLLKVWLHLPPDAHDKQLHRARKHPDKEPLVEPLDELIRHHLEPLLELGQQVIETTHTPNAPWLVIDGSDDEQRDLCLGQAVLAALTSRLAAGAPRPTEPVLAPLTDPDALAKLDLTASLDKDRYHDELQELQGRLARAQLRARERQLTTVLAFEGSDAAGKGGAIRRIARALPATDYKVVPIAAPSDEERSRHWLWRFWRALPRGGRMAIFDRSWYGRVLVERVEGLATPARWKAAYAEIVDFEQLLAEHGWLVLKFWLQIDEAEQMARFEARRDSPFKRFKLTDEDWRNREKRPAYEQAAAEMIARTHSEHAPWHVVAANDKRHARVTVLRHVVEALEQALS